MKENTVINALKEYCLLACDVMQSETGLPTFQKNILPPALGSKSKPEQQTGYSTLFLLLTRLVYSSFLKMKTLLCI
jgi:hypothetical protein